MKKCLVFVIVGLMILTISGIAAAEGTNGSVNLDYLVSGNGSFNLNENGLGTESITLQPSEYAVGVDYAFGNIVIGGEYVTGSSNATAEDGVAINPTIDLADFNYYKINTGYRIVNNEKFKLELTYSYFNFQSSDKGNVPTQVDSYNINGFMIGTKIVYNFSEKASVSLEYGTSLLSNASNSSAPFSSISGSFSDYDVKFNYLVIDNFGVAVGYRSFTAKESIASIIEGSGDITNTLGGFTLGIDYRF